MTGPLKRRVLRIGLGTFFVGAMGALALQAGAFVPPDFPRNEHGMTYGLAADAPTPGYMPDLVAATATNGKAGYVRRTELETAEGSAANPSEAVKKMKNLERATAEAFAESVSDQLGVPVPADTERAVGAIKEARARRGRALLARAGFDAEALGDTRANAVVAEALTRAQNASIRLIRVYEVDGTTVVGTLEVGGGTVFALGPEDFAAR